MPINPAANLIKDVFADDIKKIATRNGFGEGLVQAADEDPNVVGLTGDLVESTRMLAFAQKFPERFIECGVAEQNMAGVAAGLALSGKVPFVATYAVFCPGRNWDQVRVSVCYNRANVKLTGAHAGISVGPDGATHQALEDIAIARVLPNMVVLAPGDAPYTKQATLAAAKYVGPVYLRFARHDSPVFTTPQTPFQIGQATIFWEGHDVAIAACGPIMYEALLAARDLEAEGITCRVIDVTSIKPLDVETIVQAAKDCGAFVTAEEHQVHGGMGSAVAEALAWHHPVPVEAVAVQNRFGESGEPQQLMQAFGLVASDIKAAAKRAMARKHL
ncbi:MAG: transketolase family protein [Parcubacteria group bacterium]|nr:transketolase family protein [Parcubacteria group bacterium]